MIRAGAPRRRERRDEGIPSEHVGCGGIVVCAVWVVVVSVGLDEGNRKHRDHIKPI